MIIQDYSSDDFKEFVTIMNEFNDYIVSVDTKSLVKSFSSREDAATYARQTVKDSKTRDGFIYLAKENGHIIGFVMGIINKNEKDLLYKLTHVPFFDGWIGESYVKPESRGQGLGKKLLDKANQYFKTKDCKYCRLLVLSDNKNSIKIYKKLGFEIRDLELAKEL